MTVGFVDATVLTHMFRKHPDAIIWFKSQTKRLSITPIQWLELMVGAPGKRGQETCLQLLAQFEMVHLTPEDQTWTMNQMHTYRFRTFAHAFTPPLNPLPIAWRGDFKMRFSPPLQVLERGPGGEVSESPAFKSWCFNT